MDAKAVKFEVIEVIRGIGCLMISLFHIFSKDGDYALRGLPQGIQTLYHLSHFAMAVFFLLSGFVIGKIVFQEEKASAFNFFVQRFSRIYMLYWIFFLLSLLLYFLIPQYYHYWNLSPKTFIQDFFLIPNQYFGNQRFSLLFVSWTLTYELFFYFLATTSLLFNNRNLRFVVLCSSLLLPSWLHSKGIIGPHFFASNNLVLIAFGVIASFSSPRDLFSKLKGAASTLGNMDHVYIGTGLSVIRKIIVAAVMFSFYLFNDTENFVCLIVGFFLFLTPLNFSLPNKLWRILTFIGKRSYSFYLGHTLIILLYTHLLTIAGIRMHWFIFTTGAFISLFICAVCTYEYIEKPLEKLRKSGRFFIFP